MSDAPIACSLEGASYRERIVEIRALFARALKTSRREGPRLHLAFDAAARAAVHEMVRKERTCCAFLNFVLTDVDSEIELTITVPNGPADNADEILAAFASPPAAIS
jgi:hypothetical protein